MRTVLALVLGGSLLAGCGGGGGSSGAPPHTTTLLTINAGNQDAVGQATARAATALLGASGGVTANSSTGSPRYAASYGAGQGVRSMGSLASLVAQTLADLNAARRGALADGRAPLSVRALTIAPASQDCRVSGSFTISFVDADNDSTPSIGDTMTFTFNQCKDTVTDTINGSMAVTLSRVSFVNSLLSFAGTLSMNQLNVTDGTRAATLNGGLAMTYDDRSTTNTDLTLSVGAAGMNAAVTGGGSSDTVTFEPGFALTETASSNTSPYGVGYSTATISGTFSATSLAGSVTLQTPTTLLQLDNEDFPRAGALRVLGTGSALRLTALSASTVRVELDANLDGSYEASKDVPWGTLLPG